MISIISKQHSRKNLLFFSIIYVLFWFTHVGLAKQNYDCNYLSKIIEGTLVQIVTVNPKAHKIINISAHELNRNVAYVHQFAKKYNALLVINGGFFREIDHNLYVPAGALKINNLWQGIAYHPRGSIGWKANSDLVLIDRLKTKTTIQLGETKLPISHFNPNYNLNNYKVIVYSTIYPNFTNLNNINTQNFFVHQNQDLSYAVNINPHWHDSNFSVEELNSAKLDIEVFPLLSPETKNLWENTDFITSGAPILIKNNQVISGYLEENLSHYFIDTPHPRTAICIANDGYWKFIKTQDLTIPKLTTIMQILKCKDAINLDGGSSSDLYLSKQLFNQPQFTNMVLPITDAIMVLSE